MQKILATAALFSTVAFTSAFAQTTTLPPAPVGPTSVECSQGYKDGMNWSREEFAKACAVMSDRKKP